MCDWYRAAPRSSGRRAPACDTSALIEAVRQAGYSAQVAQGGEAKSERTWRQTWSPLAGWQFNVVVGSVLTLPLFVFEWGLGVGTARWFRMAGVRPGASRPDAVRRPLLPRRVEPAQAWPGQHGHAGRPRLHHRVCLQHVGALRGMAGPPLLHGVGLHHHADQRRPLDGGEGQRPGRQFTAGAAQPDASDRAPARSRRRGDPGARLPAQARGSGRGQARRPRADRRRSDRRRFGAGRIDAHGRIRPVDKAKGAKVYGGTTNQHGWLLLRVTATGRPRRWRRSSPWCNALRPAAPISRGSATG